MYTPSIPCASNSPVQLGGMSGLGCNSCGGTCKGMGLFDSGLDVSQWGIVEYAAVGLGLYVVFSVFSTTRRGVRRVKALPGERRKRKASALRKQADELTRKGGKKKKSGDDW